MFLNSSILHHHPALLHRHTVILDRLLTFLMAFSTLILKLSFSRSLSLHSQASPGISALGVWQSVVTGGECSRLIQHNWLLGAL